MSSYPHHHFRGGATSDHHEANAEEARLQDSARAWRSPIAADWRSLTLPRFETPWHSRPPECLPRLTRQPISCPIPSVNERHLQSSVPDIRPRPSHSSTSLSIAASHNRVAPSGLEDNISEANRVSRTPRSSENDSDNCQVPHSSGYSSGPRYHPRSTVPKPIEVTHLSAGLEGSVPTKTTHRPTVNPTLISNFQSQPQNSFSNSLAMPSPPSFNSATPHQMRTRRRSSTASTFYGSTPSINLNTPTTSRTSKRRRTSGPSATLRTPPAFSAAKSIEQIDLSQDSDTEALASTLAKQRADAVSAQSHNGPNTTSATSLGKSKLNTLQCTICLDVPTDLTATSCGHTFCYACLMDWLVAAEKEAGGRRGNCPACRKPVSRLKKGEVVPLEIKVMRRRRVVG